MDIKEDDKDSFPILQEPTETILEKLREVDPVMADRWHPKDRRKIQRSLEIWLRTGRPASEMYAEQHGDSLQSDMSDRSVLRPIIAQPPGLRYDTLIFWVYASKDVLRSRLDSRVLDMVKNGLMEEIESLESFQSSKNAVEETEKIDKTRGIWVAIGYKEFEQYRNALKTGDVGKETLNSLKQDAILRTQAATRQYANGQIRWIRYKFLNALARSNASNSTFLLDGSDISRWDIEVSQLALNVAGKFLSGENLPEPLVMSEASREMLVLKGDDISHSRGSWIRQTCENCDVTAVTAGDWEKHINSRRHRKVATAKSKRQSLRIEQRLKQQPTTDSFVSATSADNLAKEECEGEANLGNSTM
jgi:tRNA dimethylallyltransferase